MADSENQRLTPNMLFGTFYPTGYLMSVVPDQPTADQAKAATKQAGFGEVEVFEGQSVLAHHEKLMDSRTPLERLGSVFGADEKLFQEEYLEKARAGKLILAVHVPDPENIDLLRRTLVEHNASMLRYYAKDGVVELSAP